MAKIFLVLTIILTGAAAFFGFQTYSKLGTVKSTVDGYKQSTTDAQNKLHAAEDKAKSAVQQAKDAADQLNSTKAGADKATADLATANTNLQDLQKKYDGMNDDFTKYKTAHPDTGAPPPVAPTSNPEDQKKITDLTAQLQESQALVTTLQNNKKDDEDKIATLSKQAQGQALIKARPGLEGEVMAVNQGWSFVVVNIGDRQGATANSVLIVKRGDTMIGKVRISSVEPSTSIADIVPDTVAKGEQIRPGDRVIFPLQ